MQCEQAYGGAWYFAPDRWPTADGFVPYKLLWIYWRALQTATARDALATSRGIGLAFSDGESGVTARRQAIQDAYPGI